MAWREHFSSSEVRHYELTYGPEALADLMPCSTCKEPTPVVLLDSKPAKGADPETADFDVHECRNCYGPGWSET